MIPESLAWAGVFALSGGATNYVWRRTLTDDGDGWGAPREIWMRRGLFLMPNVVSVPLMIIGAVLIVTGAVLAFFM